MEELTFAEWPLRQELRDTLAQGGFTTPTPVQSAAFEAVRAGRDLLVQSRTGTGKTLAFGLPILEGLEAGRGPVEALIIAPTRELAVQVGLALERIARGINVEVATLYGGGSYRDQFRSLERGARIVVGTPGRICDHLEKKSLKLGNCRTLVLDEADEMLDMGFAEELDKVLKELPSDRQTLLFSATMPPETKALAAKAQRNPQTISVSSGLTAAPEIHHVAFEVYPETRADALVNVLHAERPPHALVFCHTKEETERLTERLDSEGFKTAFLNGDLPQVQRTRVLAAFRRRQIEVLVATDVAARGIDVKGISHVINLGVPRDPETYVHRVGRTGRAGAKGVAMTFVPPRDSGRFRLMLSRAGIKVDMRPLPQADDVRAAGRAKVHEVIVSRTQEATTLAFHALADELLAYLEPRELVAALLASDGVARASLEAGLDIPVPKAKTVAPRIERAPRPAYERNEGQASSQAPRAVRKDGQPAAPAGPRAVREARDGQEARPPRAVRIPREADASHDSDTVDHGAEPGKLHNGKPLRAMKDHQEEGMARVHLNIGKSLRVMPGRLVQLVCSLSGIEGRAIGMIEIHQHFTFFDVKEDHASNVVDALTGRTYEGKKLKANLVPTT
jgi:ATP-dependent RNA helicase DeaD